MTSTPSPASPTSQPTLRSEFAAALARIRERIARGAARAGRSPDDILLVAVTKFVPPDRVQDAIREGVTVFGENYVQEARAKIPAVLAAVPDAEPPEWHLIGRLQSNKARYCPELFSLVQSIDSLPIAEELGKAALKKGKTAQRVLVEVNLSGDGDRAGAAPDQTLTLCEKITDVPGIRLEGLMGMAPEGEGPENGRPFFRRLRHLWERLPAENRRTLSMGMSGDFEVAIEEGATLVRIGTALFGARPPSDR